MKKIRISILLTIFCSTGFFFLHPEESDNSLKRIEKKWGMEDNEKFPPIQVKPTIENPVPIFLSQFSPIKQEFPINPAMENLVVGKFGTKITIPANSISLPLGYKRGDILTVELIEIYNDLDFITSGISLEYFDPKPNIFESAGMFKLVASYYDKPLYLKRGVKLKVEIPNLIYTDKKMKIYKLNERDGWVDKGDIVQIESNSKPSNQSSDSAAYNEGNLVFSFFFKAMDEFKWWNCDYPNPDTTCIEGKYVPVEANPPYSVTSVGIDYKNAATRFIDNNFFQINAIKGKRVKLIVMDGKGNIGVAKELNTGSLDAFLKPGEKGKCTDIGTIKIEKISRDILKDRKKLLNYLGLSDIIEP